MLLGIPWFRYFDGEMRNAQIFFHLMKSDPPDPPRGLVAPAKRWMRFLTLQSEKTCQFQRWSYRNRCGLFINHVKQSEILGRQAHGQKKVILHLAHYFLEQLRTHVNWLCTRWWFQISFLFTPKIGEDEPFWLMIFQMGWFNHQLSYASYIDLCVSFALSMFHLPLYPR